MPAPDQLLLLLPPSTQELNAHLAAALKHGWTAQFEVVSATRMSALELSVAVADLLEQSGAIRSPAATPVARRPEAGKLINGAVASDRSTCMRTPGSHHHLSLAPWPAVISVHMHM